MPANSSISHDRGKTKGDTSVEGVRELVDNEQVGERRQAIGASPVDLIEFPRGCRRCRTGYLLQPRGQV
jgi:hypothetical protein